MGMLKSRPTSGRKKTKVSAIDRRAKVGSAAWKKMPADVQWLSAWRRSHMFGGHQPLQKFARAKKVKPTNKLTTKQLLHYTALQEGTGGRFFR